MLTYDIRIVLRVAVVVMILYMYQSASGAENDRINILNIYSNSLKKVATCKIEGETQLKYSGVVPAEWLGKNIIKYKYIKDGERIDFVRDRTEYDENGQIKEVSTKYLRSIVNNNYGMSISGADSNDGKPYVSYTTKKDNGLVRTLRYMGELVFLEGYAMGDPYPIHQILMKASDLEVAEKELVDNESCVLLKGTTEYGVYKLWLDPKIGYLPRKIEILKSIDDLIGGRKMSEYNDPGATFKINRYSAVMDQVKYELIGDSPMPVQCRIIVTETDEKENKRIATYLNKRTNIEIHPNLKALGAFEPVLPNGLLISHQEFNGIVFEWDNGRVVPRTNTGDENKIMNDMKSLSNSGPGNIQLENKTTQTKSITTVEPILVSVPVQDESSANVYPLLLILGIAAFCGVYLIIRKK